MKATRSFTSAAVGVSPDSVTSPSDQIAIPSHSIILRYSSAKSMMARWLCSRLPAASISRSWFCWARDS